MNEAEVRTKLAAVFREVLRDDQLELRDEMGDWDSVVYLKLVIAIESAFSVRFTTTDIHHSKTVGTMVDTIHAKLGL